MPDASLPRIAILCGYSDDPSPRDHLPHSYAEAVVAAGGAPFLVPCLGSREALLRVLNGAEGLLITGGVDVDPFCYGAEPARALGALSPERDRLDEVAIAYALARPELPVLGICRGIQSLNAFAGGTLVQDIPTEVEGAIKHAQSAPTSHATHSVEVVSGSRLEGILGKRSWRVNSFHHQAVRDVAAGFEVAATAPDGVIEAIERRDAAFCLGLQCHPEHLVGLDEGARKLFAQFVAAAR
ncbi:gamma-glutamyl-gamma-aminobutyrate hydrolase family protein [bacterium]|nr:gamma-glutamyl-gamma-aminobutyrate hydrolase family protein [bacterium]